MKIKVHPNSSQEKILKINKDIYEVWIKEKPIKNKVNISIVKLFKKEFGLNIKIISGFTSRNKIVKILK